MTTREAAPWPVVTEKSLASTSFFDLSRTEHRTLLEGRRHVWDVLRDLEDYVRQKARREIRGQVSPGAWVVGDVYVGDGARIEPGAVILGPAILGDGCEIRSHAYIRPFVIVGHDSIVGHACELKHSLLLPECQVPHLAYVGDSLLGYRTHLGAGVQISNVKINNEPIEVVFSGQSLSTHLDKFGAVLGDYVEVGCNTVLNPGTLIGPRTLVVANLSLRGVYPPDAFIKSNDRKGIVPRRPQRQRLV